MVNFKVSIPGQEEVELTMFVYATGGNEARPSYYPNSLFRSIPTILASAVFLPKCYLINEAFPNPYNFSSSSFPLHLPTISSPELFYSIDF